MIPEAAVEAAARAMGSHRAVAQSETTLHISCTCHRRLYTSDLAAHQARAALEAAAPHMLAEAKAGALEEAAQDFEDNIGVGEFNELAQRDGRRWTHIEDAWEYQGPYMDWLRARAAAVRGEG